MRHRVFLQLYKACLELFPNRVRQRHAEQMYLTAQDMLQDTQGVDSALRIAQLLGDMGRGLVREHLKQSGGAAMNKQSQKVTPRSMIRAAVLGLQIVMVPTLAYVAIMSVIDLFPVSMYQDGPYAVTTFLQNLLLPVSIVTVFYLAGKLHMSLWNRVVTAFVVGFVAPFIYYSIGNTIVMQVWEFSPLGILHGSNSYIFEWVCIVLYPVAFYLIGLAVVSRLTLKPVTHTSSR